jgi:hypothetical protein
VDRRERGDLVPVELLEFDPGHWSTPFDRGSWRPGYKPWKAARRAFMASHGRDSLGGVEGLKYEVWVLTHPPDAPPGEV